jgi:hypothetical protein
MPPGGSEVGSNVSIVVLNWNGRADTLACLRSLQTLANESTKVFVVDNGSTDGSVAAIRAAHPEVELIETGSNLGYAGGNNVGIERAVADGADFLLVLNNDTTCAPNMVEELLRAAARHPRAGMLCPRMFYAHEPDRVWFDEARWDTRSLYFAFPGQDRLEAELSSTDHGSDFACGAALFVRAEVIREIGAFDARYFLVWEEADWCYRARKHGWSCMVVPAAKVWHKVGASFGSEASPLRTYFSSRNRLVWLFRHGSLGERIRALAATAWSAVPRWRMAPEAGVPWVKRIVWAGRDWAMSAAGHGERLEYLAKRRAFLDFLRGQLGSPPPIVQELNRRWSARQRSKSPTAAA